MNDSGYGEQIWYDTADHTLLHEALRADPDATIAAAARRPTLMKSMTTCAECAEILHTDEVVDTPVAYGRRVQLHITLADIANVLRLPGDHQALYVITTDGEHLTCIVQCPPDETGSCALESLNAPDPQG